MRNYESKKRYSKISYTKRVKLIDLIEKQGLGVTKASKQLRIKVPTAKVILRNFRNKGRIYIKKSQKPAQIPSIEPQVPQVKEEEVEEPEREEPQEIPQQGSFQVYPYLNWGFIFPYGPVMML